MVVIFTQNNPPCCEDCLDLQLQCELCDQPSGGDQPLYYGIKVYSSNVDCSCSVHHPTHEGCLVAGRSLAHQHHGHGHKHQEHHGDGGDH